MLVFLRLTKTQKKMAKHFKIGGSTAKRTLRCPAWVNKAAKLPQVNRSSAAAERGTAVHEVLEYMVANEFSLDDAMARVDYPFDDYDRSQMITAYQAVETLWAKYQIEEFETEPLMSVADDVGGSADIVAAGREWTLIADFKFGRGPVDPINNPQILFYHWLATQDPTVNDLATGRKLVGAITRTDLLRHLVSVQRALPLTGPAVDAGGSEPLFKRKQVARWLRDGLLAGEC